MSEIKLICLDVDGTLVDGNSWFILTKGLGCSTQEHLNIFERAKKGEVSFIEGERMLTKMYLDSGNANKLLIKKVFAKIQPRLEAKSLIKNLKNKGYQVYLVSGAIDIYVKEIARKLNADGFYANSTLEFNKNGVLKKIHYRESQGKLKVQQLGHLIKKLNIHMDNVVFVGDSENDIEVFKKTGKGIAVHSYNQNLKKVAWKSVDRLSQIKTIL